MRKLVILFTSLLSIQVFSQDTLDVETAVSITLQNNFSILISRNELKIAENNTSLGNAGFLPRVDADASYTRSQVNSDQEYFDGRRVNTTSAVSENLSAGVRMGWTIFDGLGMFSSHQRFKTLRDSEKARLKLEIENNIAAIIRNFYDIVRLYGRIEVLERTLAISEERVRISESKKEVGSASKFELLQAKVDLNEDKSSYFAEELRLSDAKTALNILLGRSPSINFIIQDTIIIEQSYNFEELQDLLLTNNSEIILAEKNVRLGEIDKKLASSSWFPRIELTAGYDYLRLESQSGFLKANKSSGFNYGLLAFFNLFNGFNTALQVENSMISHENSKLIFREVQYEIQSILFNTYKRYEISLNIIELENENYKAAEENAGIALERLRLGSITPLEFREAQIDLINAQNRLVNAQFEAKSAETELLRLTGQLIKETP